MGELHEKGKKLAAFLANADPEKLQQQTEKHAAAAKAEYDEFKAAFKEGRCYLCSQALSSLAEGTPCPHWLLNPKGFRKRHFPAVTKAYGYHQLQNYLRWIANEDAPLRNINDLPDEGSGKMLEVTIKYKNLDWSFSCTENDFHGHGTGSHQEPHYHFQMRDGAATIIRFNDYHVPFNEYDVITLAAERSDPGKFKRRYIGGEGMNEVMSEAVLEKLIDVASSEGTEDQAPLKFDSILTADEGTTISGDDIADVIEEAKRSGVPIASLLRKGRIPNAKVQTVVTPGPGVVEQAIRSGRGRPGGKED